MARNNDRNSHEFIVSGVELAEYDSADGIAIVLEDVHGGKVRLHLNREMAQQMCSRVAHALTKKTGA